MKTKECSAFGVIGKKETSKQKHKKHLPTEDIVKKSKQANGIVLIKQLD